MFSRFFKHTNKEHPQLCKGSTFLSSFPLVQERDSAVDFHAV